MKKNFNKSMERKAEHELEKLIDKIIKRKMRRIDDNFNSMILGASKQHLQRSSRELGNTLFGKDNGFKESSTQVFSQLAHYMNNTFFKNL